MNINDIFDVFEQLGIMSIVKDNKVKFYDIESGFQFETWEDKTNELSLDNLQMQEYYTLSLKSPSKMIRFQLTQVRVDKEIDRNPIILKRIYYGDDTNFRVVDLLLGRRYKAFELKSYNGNTIRVESGNYINFEINNKIGVYDNGYDEGYDLSEDEMREALDSNKEIQIFAKYYGKIYPEILDTLQNVESHSKVTPKL